MTARRHLDTVLFVVGLLLAVPIALSATLWSGLSGAAEPPLRLISDVWPPFTDVEGKPREALNLVESALLRGGRQSTFSIVTWSAAAALLEQGKVDGSAAIWKDDKREKYLLFSKPYMENRLVLVTRKGGDVSATSVAALTGRLALTKGYAYGDAVTGAANVQVVYADDDAACLRAVLAKRADYVLLDELVVRHLFQFHAERAAALLSVGKVALVTHSLHFALNAKYPRAREILSEFDRNIQPDDARRNVQSPASRALGPGRREWRRQAGICGVGGIRPERRERSTHLRSRLLGARDTASHASVGARARVHDRRQELR